MDTSVADCRKITPSCFHETTSNRHNALNFPTNNRRFLISQGIHFPLRTFKFLFLVFWTLLTHNNAFGFNLDVKFPTIVTIPEQKTYFGFSVDMYAGDTESWLLVGAPKSNSRGDVFMCRYENNIQHNCTVIELEKEESASSAIKDMFGTTLKTGPNGKELVICAPYFTEETVVPGAETYYDMLGVCYFMNDFMNTGKSVFQLLPCKGGKGVRHEGDRHGQCEVGMSAAFTKDGDYLVLGAIGSYYRQGSIMLFTLPFDKDITKLPVHTAEKASEPYPSLFRTQYVDENYFGYAVATGRSIEDFQLLFSGAPRRYGYDILGMVVVYDQTVDTDLYNFIGGQTGEYFGSALASADLNNDGLDDLVVGAPLYSDMDRKLVECGRIYVYYQLGAFYDTREDMLKLNFSEPIVIKGTKGRARFGNSITAIGDINQDGYADIAVGAPYAVNDEKSGQSDGSLFIFNGGPAGIIIPASQEIEGLKLNGMLNAFGYSSAGNKDVDRNGYPDVIAGAYLSDQAVLLRSRPVIEISSTVTTDPQVVNIEDPSCSAPSIKSAVTSCFKIRTCFSYSGKNIPPSIQIGYKYDIDAGNSEEGKRAFILDDKTPRNLTLIRKTAGESKPVCREEFAYFNIDIRDKLSEVIVKVSHSLVVRNEPVEPVLNELKPPYSSAIVDIFKDCGDDDICQADLRVSPWFGNEMVYAGKAWPVVLRENIRNLGEPAFLSTLVVEFPKEVSYVGTQDTATGVAPLCTNLDQFVTCEVGNPLKRNVEVDVNLKFQTTKLNGNFSSLNFKSFVNSTNSVNNTSGTISAALSIGVKSDILMYNISSPDAIYLKDPDREEKLTTNLTNVRHAYEIVNKGPSQFSAATIEIRWPLKTRDGLNLMELVQILETEESISCSSAKILKFNEMEEVDNSTDTANYYFCDGRAQCVSTTCKVNGAFDETAIAVEFKLPLSTILRNDMDSFIKSELTFTIDEYPYAISSRAGTMFFAQITTPCLYIRQPVPKEVQWWIIAIAVGAGLLFLFLIVFILWRCKFFERKRKPEGAHDMEQTQKLNPKAGPDDDAEEMQEYLK